MLLAQHRPRNSRQFVGVRRLLRHLIDPQRFYLLHFLFNLLSVFCYDLFLHFLKQVSALRKMFDSCVVVVKLLVDLAEVEVDLHGFQAVDFA